LDFRFSKLNPLIVGAEIKQRIKREVGEWLTCSVGIAQNKFMAKLAADMQKPDGLSIIWRDQLAEIYKHKQLTDLWGISHGWQKRLARLNITSPLQLLDYPVQNLISLFGKPGFFLWQRVNGLEEDVIVSSDYPSLLGEGGRRPGEVELIYELNSPSPVAPRHPPPKGEEQMEKKQSPKSFGHSWVLNFRTTDKERLKIVILRLAEKASRRMRAAGFVALGIYLSVRLTDGDGYHRSKKLNFEIETGIQAYEQALKIWQNWEFKLPVMHVAVGFTYLSQRCRQLELFSDKYSSLTPVLDSLNDKYGEFTVRSGLLTDTKDFAPDAIAFGK
jgi:DNA polymerase-4